MNIKIKALLIICLFTGSTVVAQTAYIKGGPQLASLSGNQRADNGQYLSFLFGVGFETPIQSSNNLDFSFETQIP